MPCGYAVAIDAFGRGISMKQLVASLSALVFLILAAGTASAAQVGTPAWSIRPLVLFEGQLSAETAYKGLMDAGYIVRWLPGQGLPHGLRITIGTEAEIVHRSLEEGHLANRLSHHVRRRVYGAGGGR